MAKSASGTEIVGKLRQADVLLAQGKTGTEYLYGHDHLYSPAVLFSSSGTVSVRYEYDAYGRRRQYTAGWVPSSLQIWGNYYAFTGRELDWLDGGNLQVMYYRARYYDPDTGRFLQRDPLGINPAGESVSPFDAQAQYTDGMNLYEYIKSNPIIYLDPQGYMTNADLVKKYTKTEWDKQTNCIDTVHVYGHGYQDDYNAYIGSGKHMTLFLPRVHMPNGPYCCVIKVWLRMCYVGRDPRNLERIAISIARSNPGKWVYVCGCDDLYVENWILPQWLGGWCEGRWVCRSAKR